MPSERFPKRKYLRLMREMDAELGSWRESYLREARNTPALGLAGRLEMRAEHLRDAIALTRRVFDVLEELPRLK